MLSIQDGFALEMCAKRFVETGFVIQESNAIMVYLYLELDAQIARWILIIYALVDLPPPLMCAKSSQISVAMESRRALSNVMTETH